MFKTLKKINFCHVYIFLWIVLFLQYNVFHNSLLVLLSLGPALLFSLYYMFYAFSRYNKSEYILSLFVFIGMMVLYGLILMFSGETIRGGSGALSDNRDFMLNILISMSPLFAFYVFAREGKLNIIDLKLYFFIYLALFIIEHYYYEAFILNALTKRQLMESTVGVTNKAGYHLASLIPLLFLFRKKTIWQFLLLIPIAYFVIISVKRGAILTATLCIVWFIMRTFKERSKLMRFFTIVLVVTGAVYLMQFLEYLVEGNAYFQLRLEETLEGDTSGRSSIMSQLWDKYNMGSAINILLGYGANATIKLAQINAHNDWLEILVDCGLFGFIVYFVYWFNFARVFIHSKSIPVLYSIIGSFFIYLFVRTMISMSYGDMTIPLCMGLAYCVAYVDAKRSGKPLNDDINCI